MADENTDLLVNVLQALRVRKPQEIAAFLEALLSPKEIENVADRWRVWVEMVCQEREAKRFNQHAAAGGLGISETKVNRACRVFNDNKKAIRSVVERFLDDLRP